MKPKGNLVRFVVIAALIGGLAGCRMGVTDKIPNPLGPRKVENKAVAKETIALLQPYTTEIMAAHQAKGGWPASQAMFRSVPAGWQVQRMGPTAAVQFNVSETHVGVIYTEPNPRQKNGLPKLWFNFPDRKDMNTCNWEPTTGVWSCEDYD